MSLGKLTDAGHLGEQFKDMTIEEFKDMARATFWQTYGRYESATGQMYCELEHNGDADHTKGSVKWRKGITNGEVLEDEVLERDEAIPKFFELIDKGYTLAFHGITDSDFKKGFAEQAKGFSQIKRDGLLGMYVNGKKFVRVNENVDKTYSIEHGYDGLLTGAERGLNESEALAGLQKALDDGFVRDGQPEPELNFNPFEAWGIGAESSENDSELEKSEPKLAEGQFDMSAFEGMFDD